MATKFENSKKVTLILGAGIILEMSGVTAAEISAPNNATDVLSVVRHAVNTGETTIGHCQLDSDGKLRLSQFGDTWNKQFNDRSQS